MKFDGDYDMLKRKNQDQTLRVQGGLECEYIFKTAGLKRENQYLGYYEHPEKWLEFQNYGVEIRLSDTDEKQVGLRIRKPEYE